MTFRKILSILTVLLLCADLTLVPLSWLLYAAGMPGVHSLLSASGIRWLFSSSVSVLSTPLTAWLFMMAMSAGTLARSGLCNLLKTKGLRWSRYTFRERFGMKVFWGLLSVCLIVLAFLTLSPHAVLLSVTGSLFPSPFSEGLVAVGCVMVALLSFSFAYTSGQFRQLTDLSESFVYGMMLFAPLFVVCFLASMLYCHASYVFY